VPIPQRFQQMSIEHRQQAGVVAFSGVSGPSFENNRYVSYFRLSMKYWREARRPWLPVKPDPPEPE
jgi:hypothetical protein